MCALKLILMSFYLSVDNALIVFANLIDNNLKLELVQILMRHGARTPINCEKQYLWHVNDADYEPWGYNQLTDEGMRQSYSTGLMLRDRYKNFLPDLYRAENVYAYSSATDRTKASLQLVLAGLYPPTGDLIWNEELKWLPATIYSVPREFDILIEPRDCPKFIEHLDKLYNTTEFITEMARHKEILQFFRNIYGKNFKFNDLICAYNIVQVQKYMNLSLPHWYTDETFEELSQATIFYLDTLSYTPTLNKLNGGTIINRFLKNLENSNLQSRRRKIYLYSGGEKNLYGFLKAHGLTFHKIPDFSSAIIFEKLRDQQNRLYVRLLLWSEDPKRLKVLKLKKCAEVCPIDEYLNIISTILPSDEDMHCLYKNLSAEDIEEILNTENASSVAR